MHMCVCVVSLRNEEFQNCVFPDKKDPFLVLVFEEPP